METNQAVTGADLYHKLSVLGQYDYDRESCDRYASIIEEVRQLKAARKAVILAHNYQRPEIFEVADFIGDSLELARKAKEVREAEIIVFCGVHFMAETAKVFNPERIVLLPDLKAGCSLADSVTAEALAERKDELLGVYPDLKVVSYVNCTADVKALNATRAAPRPTRRKSSRRSIPSNILFVPDQNLAGYVQGQTRQENHLVGRQLLRASSDNVPRKC